MFGRRRSLIARRSSGGGDPGVAIDMIRCAKLARDRRLAGPVTPLRPPSKHPPEQMTDDDAVTALEAFIAG